VIDAQDHYEQARELLAHEAALTDPAAGGPDAAKRSRELALVHSVLALCHALYATRDSVRSY
jgi:hypothetical protein